MLDETEEAGCVGGTCVRDVGLGGSRLGQMKMRWWCSTWDGLAGGGRGHLGQSVKWAILVVVKQWRWTVSHTHQIAAQLMVARGQLLKFRCDTFFCHFKLKIQWPLGGFRLSFFQYFGITISVVLKHLFALQNFSLCWDPLHQKFLQLCWWLVMLPKTFCVSAYTQLQPLFRILLPASSLLPFPTPINIVI